MVLQKTLKSVQLHLHALMRSLEDTQETTRGSVTAGAWTRARAKLRHTAFIELNEEVLLKEFYRSDAIELFQGRRLLAIDGSVIALPSSQGVFSVFGEQKAGNQNEGYSKSYAQGQCGVVYDVLNNLALKARLDAYGTSELSQARDLLPLALRKGDIVTADRGFANAPFMSCVLAADGDFVVRVPRKSFKQSRALFEAKQAGQSVTCDVMVERNSIGRSKGEVIRTRFVSVDIPGGQREVIATSLLDEQAYPAQLFGWLYHQRWGVETYFHELKNRLDLENFSGRSVESIYQDFYAMIFVSNYETVLTRPAQEDLTRKKKPTGLPVKVNHSVSYHLIKEYALDLFFSDLPEEAMLEKLTQLFQQNPNYKRQRDPTAHNNTSRKTSANYRKRIRKITF